MSIITLTTDMGTRDHYVGVLKGTIFKLYPEAKIVDLSHQIKPFYVPGAAMTVRNSYSDFPRGTVHLIGVNPNRTERIDHLAVEYKGQYFIGADNGMFPLIFNQQPTKICDLSLVARSAGSSIFPTRDIFAVAACHLAQGGIMEILGRPAQIENEIVAFSPAVDGPTIRGVAIHIDIFGNIVNLRNVNVNLMFEVEYYRTQKSYDKARTTLIPDGNITKFSSSGSRTGEQARRKENLRNIVFK